MIRQVPQSRRVLDVDLLRADEVDKEHREDYEVIVKKTVPGIPSSNLRAVANLYIACSESETPLTASVESLRAVRDLFPKGRGRTSEPRAREEADVCE